METASTNKHSIHVIYILVAMVNFAIALLAYVNSTFLTEVTGNENTVSLVYTIGSILALIGLAFIPLALRRYGNYLSSLTLTAIGVVVLAGLAWINMPIVIIVLFLFFLGFTRVLAYNVDLLLEHFSQDNTTGTTRGVFLSISHAAWLLGPLVAGFILGADNYWRLYAIAAALFLITLPLLTHNFRHYHDPIYDRTQFWQTLKRILQHKNIKRVFSAYFLLRFFYAWMVIYTPIYLHEHIGLPWEIIGIVFTIMLLPFPMLQYPLGKIADTKLGEKELMIVGFIVLAVTTALLAFINGSTWWVWALALFATRIGASIVEIMGETYFFKKIDDHDSELLGFFRMTTPLSYVIAPLVASIVLSLVDFRFLFLALGALMLIGIYFSARLRDTL